MDKFKMVGLLLTLGLLAPQLNADDTLERQYGRGVHAYFAGATGESVKSLTSVIEKGTKDPRVFYYRGLALLAEGKSDAGTRDFRVGAQLEAAGYAGPEFIGRALERVQGKVRLQLEEVRQAERVAYLAKGDRRRSRLSNQHRTAKVAVSSAELSDPQNVPDVSGVRDATAPFGELEPGGGKELSAADAAAKHRDDVAKRPSAAGEGESTLDFDDPFAKKAADTGDEDGASEAGAKEKDDQASKKEFLN